jgi:hypothetical protein
MKAHIVPLEAGIVRGREISGDYILALLRPLKSSGGLVQTDIHTASDAAHSMPPAWICRLGLK